jgi:dihydroorotate dehydrogenase (NAD+) catalytic subunit
VVQSVSIPVIGMGGIMDYRDAIEFLIAGAKAIQIGTANFVTPDAGIRILDGMREFCMENNITCLDQLINTLQAG